MKTVAVTGGIGSGKSFVCKILEVCGHPVYDSDTKAKELLDNSKIIREKFLSYFGKDIFSDGKVNRQKLAGYLFKSKECRSVVESVVHPEVISDFLEWKDKQQTDIVFIESAIVFESGLDNIADEVWCVTAPQEVCINRVMKRSNLTREEVFNRISSQMDAELRKSLSTYIINNDGVTPLMPQIYAIFPKI